ncbi:MAG: signal peptidase II [Clostridiales bacterium]|jgi:signal peptidase II|nr:signal peptidase II [Clostridiales bacterium]
MRILKTYVFPALIVGLALFIDQITKFLAIRHLAPLTEFGPARDRILIDGFLRLTFTENDGMALGLLSGWRWLFIVATVVILAALFYFYITAPKTRIGKIYQITILVLIGGALGNFVDRVLRGGFVVDFIIFEFFPFVFNFADVFVVVSVIGLIVLTLFMKDEKKEKSDA